LRYPPKKIIFSEPRGERKNREGLGKVPRGFVYGVFNLLNLVKEWKKGGIGSVIFVKQGEIARKWEGGSNEMKSFEGGCLHHVFEEQ
jgi:hypothetical protein